MKYIVALTFLLLLSACTAPSETAVRADVSTSEATARVIAEDSDLVESSGFVGFEGFGPGKSHVGNFSNVSILLASSPDQISDAVVEIDLRSVQTGIERLDGHLLGEDFFDVENHPISTYNLEILSEGVATGTLTFLGQTRQISFPVEISENSIAADFVIDFSQFGMSYAGANDEVRVFFTAQI